MFKVHLIFRMMFLVTVSLPVLATDQNQYTFYHTVFGTSSEYHSKSLDAEAEFSKTILLNGRHSEGYVLHENFKVDSFTAGYRFNGIASKPALRAGFLSREFRSSQVTTGILTLKGENIWNKKLFYVYQIGYIPMTEEFQTSYTVREVLRGSNVTLGGSYRLSDKWRSTFYFQNHFFNDDNTRLNQDVGLLYGLGTGDPWVWIGVGGSRMSNSKPQTGYWTPQEFYNIGPRLDFAMSFLEKWRVQAGLNLNYFKDIKTGDGVGHYSMTRLFYKLSKRMEAFTALESIQSQQSGNIWKSNGISVGLSGTW